MAKPVKFAHVVYMTRRFEQMLDWYKDVFEADVVYENPALAFLTYDDEHHRFAFANLDVLKPGGGSADDRGEIGVNHVAYTYASVADLLDTYARLKRSGITLLAGPPRDHFVPLLHRPRRQPDGVSGGLRDGAGGYSSDANAGLRRQSGWRDV